MGTNTEKLNSPSLSYPKFEFFALKSMFLKVFDKMIFPPG